MLKKDILWFHVVGIGVYDAVLWFTEENNGRIELAATTSSRTITSGNTSSATERGIQPSLQFSDSSVPQGIKRNICKRSSSPPEIASELVQQQSESFVPAVRVELSAQQDLASAFPKHISRFRTSSSTQGADQTCPQRDDSFALVVRKELWDQHELLTIPRHAPRDRTPSPTIRAAQVWQQMREFSILVVRKERWDQHEATIMSPGHIPSASTSSSTEIHGEQSRQLSGLSLPVVHMEISDQQEIAIISPKHIPSGTTLCPSVRLAQPSQQLRGWGPIVNLEISDEEDLASGSTSSPPEITDAPIQRLRDCYVLVEHLECSAQQDLASGSTSSPPEITDAPSQRLRECYVLVEYLECSAQQDIANGSTSSPPEITDAPSQRLRDCNVIVEQLEYSAQQELATISERYLHSLSFCSPPEKAAAPGLQLRGSSVAVEHVECSPQQGCTIDQEDAVCEEFSRSDKEVKFHILSIYVTNRAVKLTFNPPSTELSQGTHMSEDELQPGSNISVSLQLTTRSGTGDVMMTQQFEMGKVNISFTEITRVSDGTNNQEAREYEVPLPSTSQQDGGLRLLEVAAVSSEENEMPLCVIYHNRDNVIVTVNPLSDLFEEGEPINYEEYVEVLRGSGATIREKKYVRRPGLLKKCLIFQISISGDRKEEEREAQEDSDSE